MTVTPARGGYPMLRIAQQFGLDYGDVLCAAQSLRQVGIPSPMGEYPGMQKNNAEALARCSNAVGAIAEIKLSLDEFRRIQVEGVVLG